MDKICTLCDSNKPIEQFSINRAKKDGLSAFCKGCAASRRKGYYTKNKDHINEVRKKNRKKYRDKEITYNREYRKNNLDKRKAYAAKYHAEHREEEKARGKRYREANRQKVKEVLREYRDLNAEKIKEYKRKYRENNPEVIRQHHLNRRVKKAKNESFFVLKKEIRKLMSSPCVNCGSTDNPTIDHIIPVSRGGRNSIGNYQTLCKSCNCSKHNKTIMEWRITAA